MSIPQIINGRFRIQCEIGTGGMATVYRATQIGLERPVAVKVIKSEFAGDSDIAARFMREARTMAKLRHPRAAMIFDAGNLPDGRHFIVMEFVEGTTLSEELARHSRLSAEGAIRIGIQICDVLEDAHQLGIIHRDLKPSNIMLNERGVCVLDFGVAKVLASSTESTATHASTGSGQIVGTPRYMSPEQCLGQRVGARSDLYSLGVLLYEMLSGRPPFMDASRSALLIKQATAPPPPLPTLRPDIPRALTLAVHTLLSKQPDHRPRTAENARAMLEQCLVPATRVVPDVEPFRSTVAAVSARRSLAFRVMTPLLILTMVGTLLFVWGHSGESAKSEAPGEMTAAADATSAEAKPGIARSANAVNLALDDARRIRISSSHGSIGDVAVTQTATGPQIVAIHDERDSGRTQFFIIERRGSHYYVSARGRLDKSDFRGAVWKSETLNANGDGMTNVLFTGTNARGRAKDYRFVLYVPKTQQSYSLEAVFHGAKRPHVIWSANASKASADQYRRLLASRARSIHAT